MVGVKIFYLFYTEQPFHDFGLLLNFIYHLHLQIYYFILFIDYFISVPIISKYHRVHHDFKEPLGLRAAYTHP